MQAYVIDVIRNKYAWSTTCNCDHHAYIFTLWQAHPATDTLE